MPKTQACKFFRRVPLTIRISSFSREKESFLKIAFFLLTSTVLRLDTKMPLPLHPPPTPYLHKLNDSLQESPHEDS